MIVVRKLTKEMILGDLARKSAAQSRTIQPCILKTEHQDRDTFRVYVQAANLDAAREYVNLFYSGQTVVKYLTSCILLPKTHVFSCKRMRPTRPRLLRRWFPSGQAAIR